MKRLLALPLLALSLSSPKASAVAMQSIGYGGYQVAEAEDQRGGGPEGGALLKVAVTKLGSASLLLGGGAKYSMLAYKVKDTDVSIDLLAVEASTGLALPLGQGKLLELGLGYDLGLSGSVKGKAAETTTSHDVAEARRLNQEARLLFAIAKSSSVGFGVTWFTQSISASGTEGDIDVKGYVLSGAYAVAF